MPGREHLQQCRGCAKATCSLGSFSWDPPHPTPAHPIMLCIAVCRYASVEDLGSPGDAANKLLDRYLNKEFMSTRIGISRQGEVLAASSREKDGRMYYDIEVSGGG